MKSSLRYDVIVLGSGFAGSLLATILSRKGQSVALLDKAKHPRFAIGESATPAADFILRDLAEEYDLPELIPLTRFGPWRSEYPHLRCGCKRGFSYFWHGGGDEFQPTVDHRHELLVAASANRHHADTQWYRPDVDQFFANLAETHTVELFENANIIAIEHPRTHDWRVEADIDARRESLAAGFLIDATGRASVLLQALDVKDLTDELHTNSSAIYGHWEHVRKSEDWLRERGAATRGYPYPSDDAAVHHLFNDGWLWQLRFEDGLTSVGFVARTGVINGYLSPNENWENLLAELPALRNLMASAAPAKFPGRLMQTGRLQRLWSTGAGEDWAALPATIGFVDPLHSTGIAHSLAGVERLGRILQIEASLRRSDALANYSAEIVGELRLIDRLVAGCYKTRNRFELFTAWCMLYFAAATTFERRRSQGDRATGFLCGDDSTFVQVVESLFAELDSLEAGHDATDFIDCVRQQIEPFNHVGLFNPATPNMYRHTAAPE